MYFNARGRKKVSTGDFPMICLWISPLQVFSMDSFREAYSVLQRFKNFFRDSSSEISTTIPAEILSETYPGFSEKTSSKKEFLDKSLKKIAEEIL